MLSIELFGQFSLCYQGHPVQRMDQPRLQALLAYLLLHRNAPQTRTYIAYQFWPDTSDQQALTNLRNLLHLLTKLLPDAGTYLQIHRQTVQWNEAAPFDLDVHQFERAAAGANEMARTGQNAASIPLFEKAIHIYKEELLPGSYADWVLSERERLRQLFLEANETLVALLESQHDYPSAITYAQNLLRHDPLHEATYRRLMRLYALSGDAPGALRVYKACADLLWRELSIEPSPATNRIYEDLHTGKLNPQPRAAPRETARNTSPLVGRQPEWNQVQSMWQVALSGRPHFLLLEGEAGMGKTHLAQSFTHWAAQNGALSLTGRCSAVESRLAFAPVIDWLLSHPLPDLEDDWLEEFARLSRDRSDAEQAPSHIPLFLALARLIHNMPPPLLLLENLQWCDPHTLEWLHYLLHTQMTAPILVVGTLRPEEAGLNPALGTFLSALDHGGQLHAIELAPLDAQGTAQLAFELSGKKLPEAQVDSLFRETEGIPLLIVEAFQAGWLEAGPPRSPTPPLPALCKLVEYRLSLLSPSAQSVIHLAAQLGQAFSYQALRMGSALEESALVDALDELVQRHMLREQGADEYAFPFENIRQGVLSLQSQARRRLLRQRVQSLHLENQAP